MAKIVSIADEVYRELGDPSDLSIATISFWLRTNLGQLNNMLNLDKVIDETTLELEEELTVDQAVIFKKLYFTSSSIVISVFYYYCWFFTYT